MVSVRCRHHVGKGMAPVPPWRSSVFLALRELSLRAHPLRPDGRRHRAHRRPHGPAVRPVLRPGGRRRLRADAQPDRRHRLLRGDEGPTRPSPGPRSTRAQSQIWADRDDVADAELLGTAIVNAKNADGSALDLTLFGVEPDGFVAPTAAEGARLAGTGEAVLSSSARDAGVDLGDVITLDRLGTELTVVGFTADQRTFGHVDIAFVPLTTWQEVHAGVTAGEQADADAYDVASAVALRGLDGQVPDLAAGDAAAGTSARTLEAAFDSSPGYTAETMTMADDQGVPLRHLRARRRGVLHALDGAAHPGARRDARHGRLDALPAHRRRAAGGRSC